MRQSLQRVVVTGRGVLLPQGRTPVALAAFRAQIAKPETPPRIADFRAADYISHPKLLRVMQRTFALTAAAAVLAMREAGVGDSTALSAVHPNPARCGVAVAMADISPLTSDLIETLRESLTGGKLDLGRFGETARHHLHPFRRLSLLANMAAAHISLLFGLQGPSYTLTSGLEAGGQAVHEAYWTIAEGAADLMVCAAADSPDYALTPSPVAEAGGSLVLENLIQAQARGIPVLAELRAVSHAGTPLVPESAAWAKSPGSGSLLAILMALDDVGRDGAQAGLEFMHHAHGQPTDIRAVQS